MTKEELRKEATMTVEWECTPMIDRPLFVHAYITGAEPREKRIAELEKENAELQEKLNIRSCQNCKHSNKSCPSDGSCVHHNKWEDYKNPQLTKAKEIIKDYMTIAKGSHTTVCGVSEENRTIYVLKLNEEAERFLEESE